MRKLSTNARILNQIDRSVGATFCFLLTAWRQLSGGGSSSKVHFKPRSILLLKLAEQGSTVLAYEAIRQAVKRVGAENVYFLLFEENRFILDLLELVPPNNILTIRTHSAFTMAVSCLQRLRQIRARRIDACVDMEFFARSTAVIAYLTGARIRVGFHAYFGEGPYRGDLMTHRLIYNPYFHCSDTFTSLIQALDIISPQDFPTFHVKPEPYVPPPLLRISNEKRIEVEHLIATASEGSAGPLILLNANASDLLPLRRWKLENYLELAKRILSTFPSIQVAFTGAPDEAEKSQHLARAVQSPRCFSLAGKTTLHQLLIVYQLAEVLITNDSGPAHFAALTNIDVITLFGPETPLLFGSPSPRNHNLWAGIACSPCINALNNRQTKCNNNVCMQMLSVDLVFETLYRVLQKRSTLLKESAVPEQNFGELNISVN